MKPNCYNRPPYVGYWFRTLRVSNGKPVWRWIEFTMSQKCGSWSAPSGELPYPVLANWVCTGCKWEPQ